MGLGIFFGGKWSVAFEAKDADARPVSLLALALGCSQNRTSTALTSADWVHRNDPAGPASLAQVYFGNREELEAE